MKEKKDELVTLTFNGNSNPPAKTLYFEKVSIKEGVNYIPSEVFESKLKQNQQFQVGLAEGYLSIVKEKPEIAKTVNSRKKKEATINITKLNLTQAKEVASSETSKELLSKWLADEKSAQARKDVIALLESNIKESK